MIISKFSNITIEGISCTIPTKHVNVRDFTPKFGEKNINNFIKMTGVEKFYKSDESQTASDLAFIAAQDIIKKKNIELNTIGCLIFVTQTPDYHIPSTACVLHKRLQLTRDCVAFDINLGCSGFVYGINVISSLIANSNIEYGLLLVGDTPSKAISNEDQSAAMLFGDAGSAVLFAKNDEEKHSFTISLRTKGEGYRAIIQQAGGYRHPLGDSEKTLKNDGNIRSDYDLYMNGTDVFNFTISEVPELIHNFLEKIQKTPETYDALVLHQANKFILKQIVKKTGFSIEQLPTSIELYGNTSVASIPLTLSHTYGNTINKEKLHLLLSGFGIGLSWGVVDLYIDESNIFPIILSDEYYDDGGIRYD